MPRPSRPASSPRPAPTAPPRSRRRSERSPARSTAARRRAFCRCSTVPPRPTRSSDYVIDLLDSRRAHDGLRAPGLPRGGSALSPASRHGDGSRLAAVRGRRGARAGRAGRAAPAEARPRARDERRVLVGRRPRRRRRAAAACAGDVRVLANRRLVGAHPRAEAARPPRAARRHATSAPAPAARRAADGLAQAAALADEYAQRGLERELATLRGEWGDEIEAAARNADYRVRAVALPRRSPSSGSGRSSSCFAAGSKTRARPCADRR